MNASHARRLFSNPMKMGEYMAKHWREHAPADVLARYDAAAGDRAAMEHALDAGGWLAELRRVILDRRFCDEWRSREGGGRYCVRYRCWGLSEEATVEAHKQLQHALWLARAEHDRSVVDRALADAREKARQAVETVHAETTQAADAGRALAAATVAAVQTDPRYQPRKLSELGDEVGIWDSWLDQWFDITPGLWHDVDGECWELNEKHRGDRAAAVA